MAASIRAVDPGDEQRVRGAVAPIGGEPRTHDRPTPAAVVRAADRVMPCRGGRTASPRGGVARRDHSPGSLPGRRIRARIKRPSGGGRRPSALTGSAILTD